MEINIIEDDYIRNIQGDFRQQYPYLKLQFYKNPHQQGKASNKEEQLSNTLPIEEVTMFHTGGKIDISPERTVAEVEAAFLHTLGLCVQVMRQSGYTWLTTTETDHWTLQQQNDKGRECDQPSILERSANFDLPDME